MWTFSGWRVADVGGGTDYGALTGALCLDLNSGSSRANANIGGRLAYAQ
jgi:hypothetical protein